jgi:hypothetical protein
MDCSAACLIAISSIREFSAPNRIDFSSDSVSVLLSSHQLTLQIEKGAGQPKRLKERNNEGVNELPY